MFQKLKRNCRPTTLLLITGFSISLTSVLIGISAVHSILLSLSESRSDAPILSTMQNTGLSLALSIYLFSIANCLVVTNYWIITRRRDMAVRKAFGWSNGRLIRLVASEMAVMLCISTCIGMILITAFSYLTSGLISVTITPFFLFSTLFLLLFTLMVSVIVPIVRILKIRPAEVIS
jgi:ABC-type antimicrobial peptide transport system permease subunit